jgi:hypothetical protein
MALDSVGSTSWHNRHARVFDRLRESVAKIGIARATVMIVGPGGVTRLLSPLLNDSAQTPSALRKLLGDAARYSDQLLRRIPIMPLVSLEPLEVSAALAMPHDMIVVDRSRRVLAAVARDLPHSKVHCVDISRESIPATADVVIAFNVVCRLEPIMQPTGMNHVAAAVRPGGLLMMDDRTAKAHLSAHAEFSPECEKTYRRSH